jgi:hypothetical protein
MDSLKFKYKVIKNFLSKEELELLQRYTHFFHRYNKNNFCEQTSNSDTAVYSDTIFEALLDKKISLMQEATGFEKLFPTYSFWRLYTYLGDLKEHRDRPSCEVSVTVQIDTDGTKYPINIEGTDVLLENGDAIAYSGCYLHHSRKPFTGDYHIQAFLHYVDANGFFKDCKFDARPSLGAPILTQKTYLLEESFKKMMELRDVNKR